MASIIEDGTANATMHLLYQHVQILNTYNKCSGYAHNINNIEVQQDAWKLERKACIILSNKFM